MPGPSISARRSAVTELGTALRRVLVALAVTEAPVERLERATELAGALEAELSGADRPPSEIPSVDDLTHGIRYLNPVIGAGNPMSPPVVVHRSPRGVESAVTLDRRYEGPPGFVHGGVTGLLFDEILGQAATHAGVWGMTAYLNITYVRAVPLDVPLLWTAGVTRTERRKTFVSGGVALASDPETALATAEALFVTPAESTYARYFDEVSAAGSRIVDVTFGAPDRPARSGG